MYNKLFAKTFDYLVFTNKKDRDRKETEKIAKTQEFWNQSENVDIFHRKKSLFFKGGKAPAFQRRKRDMVKRRYYLYIILT